jgi:hypothetical protein
MKKNITSHMQDNMEDHIREEGTKYNVNISEGHTENKI